MFIREDISGKCHLYIRLISKPAPANINVVPSGSSAKHILATPVVNFLHMTSLCVLVRDAVKGSINLSLGSVSLSSFRFFAASV